MNFKKFLLHSALLVGYGISLVTSQEEGPLLTIPQGTLLGSYGVSRDGRSYYMFRSVPYGKIPRRFDMAVLADSWDGVRNATVSGPGCLNANEFGVSGPTGVEDCLDLDIHTPILPSDPGFSEPLPVFVWIAGGGFTMGTSIGYGSKYFMDEDVILVSVNYRLGAFGTLNAGVESARGNQVMKDLVLSLKWVQQNIALFGGDPSRVTIVGESTGGGTVSLLTLSPMAQGLFSRAIMQSGVASCAQTVLHGMPGIKYAKLLAAELDCPTRDPEAMVECLRNTPANEIASLSKLAIDDFSWKEGGIHLSPTLETYSDGPNDPNIFLNEDPYVIAQRGDFSLVPMIIGQMGQEGIYKMTAVLSIPEFVERLNSQFGRFMPWWVLYHEAVDDPCAATSKIKEFYFNNEYINVSKAFEFERVVSDGLMTHCTRKMVEAYSQFTEVYAYNFTRSKPNSEYPAAHGEDLFYMFNLLEEYDFPAQPEIVPGDGNYQFSKDLIRTWANFARDGKPGTWGTTNSEWRPIVPGEPQEWLQVTDSPSMSGITQEYLDSWEFWDSLGIKTLQV